MSGSYDEQIKKMEDRYNRMSDTDVLPFPKRAVGAMIGLMKEMKLYQDAKEQRRLYALPFSIRELVYEANGHGSISEYKVTAIRISDCSIIAEWELVSGTYGKINGFEISALGKYVFLTREEAEARAKW